MEAAQPQAVGDDEHAREVGRFFALREPYASVASAVAETTERIADCAHLRRRAGAELAGWLHARYAEARSTAAAAPPPSRGRP